MVEGRSVVVVDLAVKLLLQLLLLLQQLGAGGDGVSGFGEDVHACRGGEAFLVISVFSVISRAGGARGFVFV